MNIHNYPVFFEVPSLDAEQKRNIEKYFKIRRKSGGGDCSSIHKVGENIYQIAFTEQADQERVLQRTNHVLELPGGILSLNLRGSLDPSTTTLSHDIRQLASPPDGPEHELHLDSYLLRYLKESPGAGRDLQQKLSSLGCSVQLLSEEGRAVVRGSGQAESCRAGFEDGIELGRWKVEVEKLFEQLVDRYKCHYEVDPGKVHTLLQSSTLGSEDVRVYGKGGEVLAVVVGEGSEVQAKLKEIEANPVQHLSSTKQAKIRTVCRLGQAKFRLLGEVIEKELGEFVPGVKVTRGDSSQLVLEGLANEVWKARQLVTDKTSLVMERVVSGVSPNLLTVLSEAYGRPGALGSLLGFGSQVQVEIGNSELRLFALSSEKLDQAEKTLLGEFEEEMIDIPNCDSFPPEIKSTIEKKVMEMNKHRRKVVARYIPGCRVQLLGHVKEVQELREEIQAFLIDRDSGRAVGCPQQNQSGLVSEAGINSRWEATVADTSYSLPWGLQVVVRQGDITKEEADALVNAANGDLDHAGGVAAALSRAGGPEVQRASRDLVRQVGRLATGSVVETTGGKLPCKMLLHAVGPVGDSGNERLLLEKTIKTALDLAESLELQSLAMPCISSGIFGVPLKVCSEAIVSAVRDFGREQRILTKVTLIDVRAEVVRAMQEACDRLLLGRRESSEREGGSRTTATIADISYSLPWGLQVVVRQGDITKEEADALVNAANGDLDHGGGVAAALSRAGGPGVQRASRDLVRQVGRLATGSVVETTGGKLPCKMLLHAVGPVGGSGNERPLLEKTVKTALHLAETLELQTLAMPCISSGIFGVPLKVCSEAIVSAVRDFGREQRILTKVTLIDVRAEVVRAMQEACDRLLLGRRESSEREGGSRTTTTTTNASHGDTADVFTRGAVASESCVQVEIVQGTIEMQQVDALVSPMVGSDPLSSRVGKVLSEAAGPELLEKFQRGSRDLTAPGDTVLVEGLSGLGSSRVFFLSCAHYRNTPAVQTLRQGVRNILTSCDDQGLLSVAFPVAGTIFDLQFPHKVAAQTLLEEIRRYEQSRLNRRPFLVRILVHPNDVESTKAFQTAQNTLHLSGFNMVAHPDENNWRAFLVRTCIGQ